MALDKERLKQKIKDALRHEQTEEEDYDQSIDRISDKLATAITQEIKELMITYKGGLTAPNGPVAGTLNVILS